MPDLIFIHRTTFCGNLGYRFDADQVELQADIAGPCGWPAQSQWALQLWADETVKVAELPLGQLEADAQGLLRVSGIAPAQPPAGDDFHRMSLKLVSGQPGDYAELHDQQTFGLLQSFAQPRLLGAVSCQSSGEEMTIEIESIRNPRAPGNLSGTLALELWALDAPYAGTSWSGTPVASLVIGCLDGQASLEHNRFVVHAAPWPADRELTLMLREWTSAGYVTRDYRLLEQPALTAPVLPVQELEPVPSAEPAQESAPVPVAVATTAPVQAVAVAATAVESEAAPTVQLPAVQAQSSARRVSINRASATQIRSLQGIGHKMAESIIAKRPYRSVNDLLRVKGIGMKRLEQLRAQLEL